MLTCCLHPVQESDPDLIVFAPKNNLIYEAKPGSYQKEAADVPHAAERPSEQEVKLKVFECKSSRFPLSSQAGVLSLGISTQTGNTELVWPKKKIVVKKR